MITHQTIEDRELWRKIKSGVIVLGGNKPLKIYGSLHCASGKRMKRNNRVFFSSGKEAEELGYRPCGRCLKEAFARWKSKNSIAPFTAGQ